VKKYEFIDELKRGYNNCRIIGYNVMCSNS